MAKARLGFAARFVKFYNIGIVKNNVIANASFDNETNSMIIDSKANDSVGVTTNNQIMDASDEVPF